MGTAVGRSEWRKKATQAILLNTWSALGETAPIGADVLMFVGAIDPTYATISSQDKVIYDLLVEDGHNITLSHPDSFGASSVIVIDDVFDCLYVSQSITSSQANYIKLVDLAIPIVFGENGNGDDFGFSQGGSSGTRPADATVINNTHPITAHLSLNQSINVSDNARLTPAYATGLVSLVTSDNDSTQALAALPKGATMGGVANTSGNPCPANRVWHAGDDPLNWNNDWKILLKRSIQWAIGGLYMDAEANPRTWSELAGYNSPYVASVMADEPKGFWRLDEDSGFTLSDLSGSGNDMSIVGSGFSLNQTSPLSDGSTAIYFNGSNYAETSILPIGDSSEWTIEVWFKTNTVGAGGGDAIYCERGSGGLGIIKMDYAISSGTNKVSLTIRNEIGNLLQLNFGNPSTSDNNWHHAVITRNGRMLRSYVDGVAYGVEYWDYVNNNFSNVSTVARIAGDAGDSSSKFIGSLCNVAAFQRALSLREVEERYAMKDAALGVADQKTWSQTGTRDELPVSDPFARYDSTDTANYDITNGRVSTWRDLGSNNYDLTQTTEAQRPYPSIIKKNGLDCFYWDGGNLMDSASFSETTTPSTVFSVSKRKEIKTSGGDKDMLYDLGNYSHQYYTSGGKYELFSDSAATSSGNVTTDWEIGTAVFGSSASLRVNGTEIINGNVGTKGMTRLRIGGKSGSNIVSSFEGLMPEIIIFNRLLTVEEIGLVENYLSVKYGIAIQ